MGATGFEPVKAEPADLQSAPFGHLGTRPGSAHVRGGAGNIRLKGLAMQGSYWASRKSIWKSLALGVELLPSMVSKISECRVLVCQAVGTSTGM